MINENFDLQSQIGALDADSSEETIAGVITRAGSRQSGGKLLAQFLPQQHSIYSGRGTNQVIRLRGWLLASFARTGLPEESLLYVLEELENSRDAYIVAAAARAVRGMTVRPVEVLPFLQKAIYNIAYADDAITFESYKPDFPLKSFTTAIDELLLTYEWFGSEAEGALPFLHKMSQAKVRPLDKSLKKKIEEVIRKLEESSASHGSCCDKTDFRQFGFVNNSFNGSSKFNEIAKISFEDQDGNILSYDDFFSEKPSVVSFFYTRCDNPNKCSLTVTKIAQLQQLLGKAGLDHRVKIAAVTYDSGYDHSERLKSYAESRSFMTREDYRMLRLREPENFVLLSEYFNLGVNFIGSIVNHHRIELFILDRKGRPIKEYTRLQWIPEEIAEALEEIVNNKSSGSWTPVGLKIKNISSFFIANIVPALILFFPKCPICWASYLSFLGILGIRPIPYSPWLLGVLMILTAVNLISLIYRAKTRGLYFPAVFCAAGVSALLFGYPLISYTGLFFIFIGSVFNSLSLEHCLSFKNYLKISLSRLLRP